jgi:uncharacterized protein (TIGR03437 family)
VDQNVTAGAAAPSSPLANAKAQVIIFIGASQTPATILFAGLAPGLGGLYQVNFTIPSDVSTGEAAIFLATSVDGSDFDVQNFEATIPIGK